MLGPKIAAIIDFKSCYESFNASNLNGKWPTASGKALHGGSYINPYKQAVNARKKWSPYFSQQSNLIFKQSSAQKAVGNWYDIWCNLNSFVLLHPLLHPDTTHPKESLEKDHYWFHLKSIDDILELAFSCVIDNFLLTSAQQEQLIRYALFAQEWPDMFEILHNPIGAIVIQEPNSPLVKYNAYCDDFFTIGRSHDQRIRVSRECKQLSGYHARIEITQGKPIITDTGSLNGMYIKGTKVADGEGRKMSPYLKIFLGDSNADYGCQVWYEPIKLRKTSLTHGLIEHNPTELPPYSEE